MLEGGDLLRFGGFRSRNHRIRDLGFRIRVEGVFGGLGFRG